MPAALAVLEKMKHINIPEHVEKVGKTLLSQWRKSAEKYNLPINIPDSFPCLAHFSFKHEKENELKTLYVQYMLEKGFLAAPNISPTIAHTNEIIKLYSDAIDDVFSQISYDLKNDKVSEALNGPPAHSGFKRLN